MAARDVLPLAENRLAWRGPSMAAMISIDFSIAAQKVGSGAKSL